MLDVLTIDFETYWAQGYSLNTMTTLEYIRDPRFQVISCSFKYNGGKAYTVFGFDAVAAEFARYPTKRLILLGHNMSGFDSYIARLIFNIKPAMWLCTLDMAQPFFGVTVGVSLKAVGQALGLGVKDNAILLSTRGKRLEDFTPAEIRDMSVYNGGDSDLSYGIFTALIGKFTMSELWQIDALIRMRIEPLLVVDTGLLEVALSVERSNKHKSLLGLGRRLEIPASSWSNEDELVEIVRAEMSSQPKFSALLTKLGVTVPTKPSKTDPTKSIPALAKNDEELIALLDHPYDLVQAAVRARMDAKSTLTETRIQAFIDGAARLDGKKSVAIRYCGAKVSGRDSGVDDNCFTGDVEVLTRAGWVRFDAWDGSAIMQWWPDGSATFCEAPRQVRKHYAGPMIDVDGVFLSARMTPDHRLLVARGARRVDITAGDLLANPSRHGIPAAGVWVGAQGGLTPDEVRLMVAIAADGCVEPRVRTRPMVSFGFRKPRKTERLVALLDALNIPYRRYARAPQAGHKGEHPTDVIHVPDCPYDKGFGPWILQLSRESLNALIGELHFWDGWKNHRGDTEFSTSSLEQAQWVSTACALSGAPASVRTYRGRYQLHVRGNANTSISECTQHHHDGDVFCASVESSYIFIRRNGKIAVTGQCQNLPRIGKSPKPSDALRMSLMAPPGHDIIVADQSSIELRMSHFYSRVEESMALFAKNPVADLYRAYGAARYGCAPEEVNGDRRQACKIAQLQLQYGAGPDTYLHKARVDGGLKDMTREQAVEDVQAWRARYTEITAMWKRCDKALFAISRGERICIDSWGLTHTCAEGVILPSGRLVRYPRLRYLDEHGVLGEFFRNKEPKNDAEIQEYVGWWYGEGRNKRRIYGAKVYQNIIQALARDSVFDVSFDFYRATKLRMSMRTHDELIYVVPEQQSAALLDQLQGMLRTPPKFFPQCITWSEGGIAKRYGEAK